MKIRLGITLPNSSLLVGVPLIFAALAGTAGTAPVVTTGSAQSVTANGATLTGTVNPSGEATTAGFEYGTSTAYGSATSTRSVPADGGDTPISIPATGLAPNTTYHFRLTASNASGGSLGADQTFTTGAAPEVVMPTAVTGGTSDVTDEKATLHGTVNPNGRATKVRFDWGGSRAYGNSIDVPDAGDGRDDVAVQASLSGLRLGAEVHYRVVATSSDGTTVGADKEFRAVNPPAPRVRGAFEQEIGLTSLLLRFKVDTNGTSGTVRIEYGLTNAYGSSTEPVVVNGDLAPVEIPLRGLLPATTYHYRVVTANRGGESLGIDRGVVTGFFGIQAQRSSGDAPLSVRIAKAVGCVDKCQTPDGVGVDVTLQGTPFPFKAPFRKVGSPVATDATGVASFAVRPVTAMRFRAVAVVNGTPVTTSERLWTHRPHMVARLRNFRITGHHTPGIPMKFVLRGRTKRGVAIARKLRAKLRRRSGNRTAFTIAVPGLAAGAYRLTASPRTKATRKAFEAVTSRPLKAR